MIAFLRGRIINKNANYLIIETSDIGYQVFVGENFWNDVRLGQEIETYIHHQIREDASDLYGFKTLDDLELFNLLLTVSGVGPKSALGVMSAASASDIKETIVRGDANLLTKVAGIGKKTAERLVLELKNKVLRSGSSSSALADGSVGSDELDALMSLGYSLVEARSALSLVATDVVDSGERVKAALQKMLRK